MARSRRPSWSRRSELVVLLILILATAAVVLAERWTGFFAEAEVVADEPPAALGIAAMAATPAAHFEKRVAGTATVSEVVGERAVYLEETGKRVLAILPSDAWKSGLEAGKTVRLSGLVKPATELDAETLGRMRPDVRKRLGHDAAYIAVSQFEVIG